MAEVVIATPGGRMPVYVARPSGAGPWPGVVVIHDFTGMSADLRNQADWLAGAGYVSVAPDLYHWGSRLRCLWTIARELGAGRGRTFDDIEATREWLAGDESCTGRVGVIGFCMGGGYALILAADRGYLAASTNYGGCPKNAAELLSRACPIIGSYGGRDRSPMGARAGERLEGVLTGLGIDHDVKVYPGAHHGFMNDHDAADLTPLLVFLGRISGTRYDPAATEDARRRIVSFFDRHLKASQPSPVE